MLKMKPKGGGLVAGSLNTKCIYLGEWRGRKRIVTNLYPAPIPKGRAAFDSRL